MKKAGQLMAEYLAAHGTGDTEALTAYARGAGDRSTARAAPSWPARCMMPWRRCSQCQGVRLPSLRQPASRREVARMVLATRESPPQMQQGREQTW